MTQCKLLDCDFAKKRAPAAFPRLTHLKVHNCQIAKPHNIMSLVSWELLETLEIEAEAGGEAARQLLTKLKSHVYSLRALRELRLSFKVAPKPALIPTKQSKKTKQSQPFDQDFQESLKYTISRLKSQPRLFLAMWGPHIWRLSDLVRMALFIRGKHIEVDCGDQGSLVLDTQIFNTKTVYMSPSLVKMRNFYIG